MSLPLPASENITIYSSSAIKVGGLVGNTCTYSNYKFCQSFRISAEVSLRYNSYNTENNKTLKKENLAKQVHHKLFMTLLLGSKEKPVLA